VLRDRREVARSVSPVYKCPAVAAVDRDTDEENARRRQCRAKLNSVVMLNGEDHTASPR